MRTRFLALCLILGTGAGFVHADDDPTPVLKQRLSSEDGKVDVDFPVHWKLQARGLGPGGVLSFNCEAPAAKDRVVFTIFQLPGVELTPRAQAFVERPAQRKRYDTELVEVVLEPIPQLVISHMKEDVAMVTLYAYRRLCGRGIHTYMEGPADSVMALRDAFLEISLSITCELPRWPPALEGYEVTKRKDVHYYAGEGVETKQVKALAKVFEKTQKAFQALHGKFERPDDEPVTVVIQARKVDFKSINETAAKYGYWSLPNMRRVFAIPLKTTNRDHHADFAGELTALFLRERYPTALPTWVSKGEQWLSENLTKSEKKGPFVTKSFHYHVKPLTHTLADVHEIQESDWSRYVDHARVYVMYLRHGPRKYRKAYKKFLEAAEEGGDADLAMAQHLMPFAQTDDFRREAFLFLKRKAKLIESK